MDDGFFGLIRDYAVEGVRLTELGLRGFVKGDAASEGVDRAEKERNKN